MAFALFEEIFIFSSIYVHYAHAGVMAHARILLMLTRTTRVFLTSAQLINREFLAFSSVNFCKNRLIS